MELVFVVADNTLDYHIDLFLRAKRATRKPATVAWYTNVLGYYHAAVSDLQPTWPPTLAHCLAFFETFSPKGLKDNSRNTYYRALSGWLNWLKKAGYIDQNPLDLLDPIPAPKSLPKAPPEEVMRALFDAIEQQGNSWHDVRDLALFLVSLDTGARPGELSAMLVDDVDLENHSIRVHSNKDYEDRDLVFDDDAARALALWLIERQQLTIPDELSSLWVSNYQHKGFHLFTVTGIRQRLRFWQKKAGLSRFTPYAIRHAYAIYSIRNFADLIDIRDQMGHASITTTAIYTKVVNQGRRDRHQKTSPVRNLRRSGPQRPKNKG